MIESIDTLIIALVALLPGFVALLGFRAVTPQERNEGAELMLGCLGFGVINASIHIWWLIPNVNARYDDFAKAVEANPFTSILAALAYCLVTPLVIGYLFGLGRSHLRIPGMLDPSPTAWDRFFSRRPGCIVYVTLNNGQRIAGLFSEETGGFASAHPNPQTLYCGRLFPLDSEGQIIGPPRADSEGAIIRADDCLLMEFLSIPSDEPSTQAGVKHVTSRNRKNQQSK